MEEYVKHIKDTFRDESPTFSICGKRIDSIFAFIDIDHAIRTRLADGRLLVCEDCIKKINEILNK